jgi:hypothetical protein
MTLDQTATFRAALKEARTSFDRATQRLNEMAYETYTLKEEVAKLRRTITALAAMCSESPWEDELGITDSCAEVMEAQKREVSTQDVVAKLEAMGFDLKSQKNPAASVHAVLSRLGTKGKIEKVLADDNKTVTWRGPNYSPTPDYADQGITDDDIPF